MSVNTKLTNLANEIREISGTTTKKSLDVMISDISAANDLIDEQETLLNDLRDIVDSLPEAGGGGSATVKGFGEGTPINLGPEETGTIDTIYVDTSLSEEEIINIICNNLTLADNGHYMMWIVNQSETKGIIGEYIPDSNLLGIMSAFENEEGVREETFLYHNIPEQEQKLGFIGWNPEFDGVIELNDEFTALTDFRNLGDLFSITPFGKTIVLEGEYDGSPVEFSLSGNGTPFENGTVEEPVYVENIYFNKNLSDEEMYDIIIQQDELGQDPYFMIDVDFTHILGAAPIADDNGDLIGGMFAIIMLIDDGSETGQEVIVYHNIPIEEQEALIGSTIGFVGWNPDYDGVLNIGKNMVAVWDVASLGNFISSTPFGGGSEIDMTTYINRKKLPLNIKLSGADGGRGSLETCTVSLEIDGPVVGGIPVYYTNENQELATETFNLKSPITIKCLKNSIISTNNGGMGVNTSGSLEVLYRRGDWLALHVFGDGNVDISL